MSNRYGKTYAEDTSVMYFEPGINDDVKMVKFELTEVKTARYDGTVLDVEWNKKGSAVRARIFPVNEEQITPREVGGEMQSLDEAIDKAYADIKNWIKHVVTNYDHLLPEEKQGKFDEVTAKADSFNSLVELSASLLPKDFADKKGELIVGVNKKTGYMDVPNAMWITGHFWKVEGSDKKLQVKTRTSTPKGYLNLEAPVQAPAEPAGTPKSDTEW